MFELIQVNCSSGREYGARFVGHNVGFYGSLGRFFTCPKS